MIDPTQAAVAMAIGRRAVLASLGIPELFLRSTLAACVRSLLNMFSIKHGYFALIAVEVAEQATDRTVGREIDIHVGLIH